MAAICGGCLAQEGGRPLGRNCDSDKRCAGQLVCHYGRCRTPCTFDRDCPLGAACVATADQPGLRVCTLADEANCLGDSCPAPLVCGPDQLCHESCSASCEPPRICQEDVCLEPQTDGADAGAPLPDAGASDAAPDVLAPDAIPDSLPNDGAAPSDGGVESGLQLAGDATVVVQREPDASVRLSDPALTWNGTGYAALWVDHTAGNAEVFFASLDDSPLPWNISDRVGMSGYPALSWHRDEYGIAWLDTVMPDGHTSPPHIAFLTTSSPTDGRAPELITDFVTTGARDITIARNGNTWVVAWIDTGLGYPVVYLWSSQGRRDTQVTTPTGPKRTAAVAGAAGTAGSAAFGLACVTRVETRPPPVITHQLWFLPLDGSLGQLQSPVPVVSTESSDIDVYDNLSVTAGEQEYALVWTTGEDVQVGVFHCQRTVSGPRCAGGVADINGLLGEAGHDAVLKDAPRAAPQGHRPLLAVGIIGANASMSSPSVSERPVTSLDDCSPSWDQSRTSSSSLSSFSL